MLILHRVQQGPSRKWDHVVVFLGPPTTKNKMPNIVFNLFNNFTLLISTGFIVIYFFEWIDCRPYWFDAPQFLSEYCQNYFYWKTKVYKLNIDEANDQLD